MMICCSTFLIIIINIEYAFLLLHIFMKTVNFFFLGSLMITTFKTKEYHLFEINIL